MERSTLAGNLRIARTLAREHLGMAARLGGERRMHLMRDAAKRLLRLSPLISLDALDEAALTAVVREVLAESASALSLDGAAIAGGEPLAS